ncbi:hypothetical protein [Plantactinospora sp. GCM10030261]|uniref:hypothetical protein n=1 Tax=Plantactinospora sp. GCM10030261 TaxID=3273420 RepID=UPI003611235A
MTTTLIVRRTGRGTWAAHDVAGRPVGTMHTGRGLATAELRAASGVWTARAGARGRCRVTAGPADRPHLRLEPPHAQITGVGGPVRWNLGRNLRQYRGTLASGTGRIAARTRAFAGGAVEAEVEGQWPDLVVLAVCFAVLTRKRRDQMLALQIAVITSPGPR